VFEVRFVVVWAAAAEVDQDGMLTDRFGPGAFEPGWDTAIVRVIPEPVTVTVAGLVVEVVLALAVRVSVALLDPDVGDTVSQDWLDDAVQAIFADTAVVVWVASGELIVQLLVPSVSDGVGVGVDPEYADTEYGPVFEPYPETST